MLRIQYKQKPSLDYADAGPQMSARLPDVRAMTSVLRLNTEAHRCAAQLDKHIKQFRFIWDDCAALNRLRHGVSATLRVLRLATLSSASELGTSSDSAVND